MAEPTTLARPYAKAAFEFARELKSLDRWSNMLATVASVVIQPAVQKLLSSPSFTAEAKAERFLEVCGDEVDSKVGNFIRHMANNNRFGLLLEVQQQFEELKANQEKTLDVTVSTAFELSAEQQANLANALKQKLDREVQLQSTVDASLIGGAVVRAGDLMIDGSIRGRLAKLAESMSL